MSSPFRAGPFPLQTRIPMLASGMLLFVTALQVAADEPAPPLLDFSQPRTIVCLGDSVTGVYYHTGGERAYPEMLEIAIRKALPESKVKVINAGISGNTTQNGLDRLDRDVLTKKPDLVTVTFGLNDMTRIPEEQFRKNLETIAARCREAGAKVVLCTPNSVIETGGRPRAKLARYCDVIRATAKDLALPLCDQNAAGEAMRSRDAWAWRLLFSDEIHPNMDGHRRMAEELSRTLTGKSITLDDIPPPAALSRVRAKFAKKDLVKVLAMPPYDASIAAALRKLDESAQVEVIAWPVEGQTLAQIEESAKQKVRGLKPDLVVIAVPRAASTDSDEAFVRSYSWVMNHSLSFGLAEWDALVVHPSVTSPNEKGARDDLVRQLVKAQHLHLIDRAADDKASAPELLESWTRRAFLAKDTE